MDRFSFTVFLKNLENDPKVYTDEQFNEYLLALGAEDVEDIRMSLLRAPTDVDTAKQTIHLLGLLWHYQ